MKNIIKYYYDIDINNIKNVDDNYIFEDYYFTKYYKKIDISLYNYMVNSDYKIDYIIYNKNNEYITLVGNIPYILLKIQSVDKIDLNYIMNYNIEINSLNNPNWAKLWSIKIDYYEKNINNIKNDKIRKCFNYYIGLCENAISLFKTLNLENEKKYVCHIRLNNDIDFYNPINLVADFKMRDIAEYIKIECIKNNYRKMLNFINELVPTLSYNDSLLLLIRLMYPTYFFDCYDKYQKNEQVDCSFTDHISLYEHFLKNVYKIISNYYKIPIVEWLIKK